MKQHIHPDYHPVVYRDASADFAFLTRSTATSERTITWSDGKEYAVIDVEVSSASHPFYTGTAKVLDTAGRVERFRRRYGQRAASADGAGTGASAASDAGAGTGASAPSPAAPSAATGKDGAR